MKLKSLIVIVLFFNTFTYSKEIKKASLLEVYKNNSIVESISELPRSKQSKIDIYESILNLDWLDKVDKYKLSIEAYPYHIHKGYDLLMLLCSEFTLHKDKHFFEILNEEGTKAIIKVHIKKPKKTKNKVYNALEAKQVVCQRLKLKGVCND